MFYKIIEDFNLAVNKTFSNFRRLKEIWGITRAPNIKTIPASCKLNINTTVYP